MRSASSWRSALNWSQRLWKSNRQWTRTNRTTGTAAPVLVERLESRALLAAAITNLETGGFNATQLAQDLVGAGVTVSNVVYTGSLRAGGRFTGGFTDGLEIDTGVILSSGEVVDAAGPNDANGTSTGLGEPGDTDLNGLLPSGQVTRDAASLAFDFVPTTDTISFVYIWGSDEYPEFAPPNSSSFNDIFGFFVNGNNVAFVPGTTTPVSIANVNVQTNQQFYRDNRRTGTTSPFGSEMDGFTVALSAVATVNPGVVNRIKLSVADVQDSSFDSVVFLRSGTLTSKPVVSVTAPDPAAAEPAENGQFRFARTGPTGQPLTVTYTVSGTAANGIDYTQLTGTVTIPAGSASFPLDVIPINDTFFEDPESVIVTLTENDAYAIDVGLGSAAVTITSEDIPTAEIAILFGGTEVADNTGTVDFGQTNLGSSVTRDLIVRNVGSAPLTIQPASLISGSGFTILTNVAADTVLAPGEQRTILVRMSAATGGTRIARFSLDSDDSDENPYDFTLTGLVNVAPTDILLSPGTVPENSPIGTLVGQLATVDATFGDTHTYALVTGSTPNDNALFTLSGDELSTAAVFDFETRSNFTIRVRTTDSGGLTFTRNLTVIITNVNDPPVISAFGGTINYVIATPAISVDADALISDVDSPNLASGFVQLQMTDGRANDRLSFIQQGTGAGQFNLNGTNLRIGSTIVGVVNAVEISGSQVLQLLFNSNSTPAIVTQILRQVSFQTVGGPGVLADIGPRTLTLLVDDGDGGTSQATASKTISVNRPVVNINGTSIDDLLIFNFQSDFNTTATLNGTPLPLITPLAIVNVNLGVGFNTVIVNGTSANDSISLNNGNIRWIEQSFNLTSVNLTNFRGSDGNDAVSARGTSPVFEFDGGTGNDRLQVWPAASLRRFDGGSDSDTLDYTAWTTGVSANLATGTGTGVTVIAGTERLLGGSGDDSFTGDDLANELVGNSGNDSLSGGGGNDLLIGLSGDDNLAGDGGDDTFVFDTDTALGVDTVSGGTGVDLLDFSTSDLGVSVDLALAIQQTVNGNHSLILPGSPSIENVRGGQGIDTFRGNSLNNLFEGRAGDDWYFFNTNTPQGSDRISDSTGRDSLSFAGSTDGVTVNLGTTAAQTVNSRLTLTLLTASVFDDLYGGSGNDSLTGNALPNLIRGGAGDDVLNGQSGSDDLGGGEGKDRYVFHNAAAPETDRVEELAFGGVDTLDFSILTTAVTVNLNLDNGLAVMANRTINTAAAGQAAFFENVRGSAADDLLIPNAANNLLEGLGGNDIYRFDPNTTQGQDTLVDTAGIETLDFAPANGPVRINMSQSAAQAINPNLILVLPTPTAFENLIGGRGDDLLIGNANANQIEGRGGNDTLSGLAGVDSLDGGQGDDILDGGSDNDALSGSDGNDVLFGDSGDDRLSGDAGNDRLQGALGNDFQSGGLDSDLYVFGPGAEGNDVLVESAVDDPAVDEVDLSQKTTGFTFDLTSNLQQTVGLGHTVQLVFPDNFENAKSGAGNDTLIGNNRRNRLDAGAGNDTLRGGDENDVLISGDGNDTAFGGGGNDTMTGGTGDDRLFGEGGNDILNADQGNDQLTGGVGDDALVGSEGNDLYIMELGSDGIDQLTELSGAAGGVDTLDLSRKTAGFSLNLGLTINQTIEPGHSVALSFGNAFENVLGGAGSDRIEGNELSNRLEGRNGNDILLGNAESDLLIGGSGNDLIVGGSGNDLINGNDGDDEVDGGDGNDNITGDAGNDLLLGGEGNDSLSGGTGSDTYRFTDTAEGDDTLTETSNAVGERDLIDLSQKTAGFSFSLADVSAQTVGDGHTLRLSNGDRFEDLWAGEGNDILTGNRLDNRIRGGVGNDRYVWNTDTQQGSDEVDDAGFTDTLDFSAGSLLGVTIDLGLTTQQTLNANLRLRLTSASAIEIVLGTQANDRLVGNSLNNELQGNSGDDALDGRLGFDVLDGGLGTDTAINGDIVVNVP